MKAVVLARRQRSAAFIDYLASERARRRLWP